MERRVVKPPGQDMVVERLKSRYGLARSCPMEEYNMSGVWTALMNQQHELSHFDQTKYKRRILTSPDDLDTYCSGDKVGSSLRCYSDERKHPMTPFCSSFKHLNVNCLDDELDSFHNLKKWETEKELIKDDHRDDASKITKQSFREIEKVLFKPCTQADLELVMPLPVARIMSIMPPAWKKLDFVVVVFEIGSLCIVLAV